MQAQRANFAGHAEEKGSGAITGSVAGFDGQPVTGACVTAVGAGHSVTTAASSDGTFRLFGLAVGSYALEYRDCASPDQYLPAWSGGVSLQKAAARVQVSAGQVRSVPAMTLKPVNPAAAIAARQASFQRAVAANSRPLTAAAAAKTGKISGEVTGKGKPLSGICVEALGIRVGHTYGAKTAKNGTYTLNKVATGKYEVVFAPSFFCRSHTNWLQQIYKNDTTVSAFFTAKGTHVPVRAHHTTSGISGNLTLGGQISGTVKGKSGAKARGICVTARGQFPHHQAFYFSTRTAPNGSYELHALFPGKYTLQFSIGCGSGSENYAPTTHHAVKLRLGQHLSVNQVLPTGASISGTVTLGTSSGTPLNGICVTAFGTTRGSNFGFTRTSADGTYRILGLTGGNFQVQYYPCTGNGNYTSAVLTTHTTAGQPTTGVNAVLQTGAIISGTIKNTAGNSVPGICVEVVSSNPEGAFGFSFDNKGSYSVDRLPAGTYQAGYFSGCGNKGSYASNWYNNQPSENTATPITLTTGPTIHDVFTADVVMQPGATITGKVTNTSGNAVSNVCVNAVPQSDAAVGGLVFGTVTFTRHGSYTLSNLSPGQYLINFACGFGPAKYASQWFPNAPDAGTADLLSVPAGQASVVNAVLQPAGSISGVVTGQGGHPLANVCVAALNTKGTPPALSARGASGLGGPFGFGPGAITGKNGHYRITGLAAGRYQVSFAQCFAPARYAEQWFRGKTSAQAANAVTVGTGKITSGINGRLTLGGSISGRVLNGSGKPLRNICIVASAGSAGPVGETVTTRAGTYTISGLGSGEYTEEFSPCGSQNLITVVAHTQVTAPHATTGVNATMQPGGSIAGTVTAGSATVSGSCVEVYGSSSAAPVAFGQTGVGGNYVAAGLPAGSYTVYFNDPQCETSAPGLAPQWYNGQATQATAKSVTVTAGNTTPSVDAALQPDGEITGTVSASGSPATPLSGACVTAFPEAANGSQPVVAVTSATGYTLAGILPGQYKVRFSSGCGASGYATQWYKGAATQSAATIITVAASQTASGISATLNKSS